METMNEIIFQHYSTQLEDYTYYGVKVAHFILQGPKFNGYEHERWSEKKKRKEKKVKEENGSSLLMYSKRKTSGPLLSDCFPVLRRGKRGDRSREMISATDT